MIRMEEVIHMNIYQLELLDQDYYLDPVFKTTKGAEKFKGKYQNRNIAIRCKFLDNIKNDTVYRIKNIDPDGEYLDNNIFSCKEEALLHIKTTSQIIIEEKLYE